MKITITPEDIAKAEQALREGRPCCSNCPVSQAMNRTMGGTWATNYNSTYQLTYQFAGDYYYSYYVWRTSLRLSPELSEQLKAMDKDRKNLSKHFMPGEYELIKS